MAAQRVNLTDHDTLLRVLDHSLDASSKSGQLLGLLVVQIRQYERFASAFGVVAGNELIAAFAARLRSHVRPTDRVSRIGEARFAVIVPELRNDGILQLAANKIAQVCRRPFEINGEEVKVSMRIGATTGPERDQDAERLLQNAETALITAADRDTEFETFSPEQLDLASDSLRLDSELENAIEHNELELHFQPKISTRSFRACGAEALMRWNHPDRGPISPEVFIQLADRPGRMEPLTEFLLNSALSQASVWPEKLSISINLSPRMLMSPDLVDTIGNSLRLWDFDPARLVVEITEGAIMADPTSSFETLNQIRQLGAAISIDDFGTGYSSFAYFRNIPADELKIDKSFVQNMLEDEGDRKIVRSIIQLSREFGLAVTAEGVEDERTARILAEMECDTLQGFHYSRPLPQAGFLAWLSGFDRKQADRA